MPVPPSDLMLFALATGVIFLIAGLAAWIADVPLARLDERRMRRIEREQRRNAPRDWPADVGPIHRHMPFDIDKAA